MPDLDGTERVVEDYLYLPSRAGKYAIQEFQRRSQSKVKITWGVPEIDTKMIPMTAGDLVSVVARPSNGKTSTLVHLARRGNEILTAANNGQYVMYATWETMVEEFVAVHTARNSGTSLEDIGRGNANMKKLSAAVARSISERLAVFGRSMETKGRIHNLEDMNLAMQYMADAGMPIGLLIVDYLQRLPTSRMGQDRSQSVSENLERLKDLAIVHKTPVVVAIQAKRDVDEYSGLQMPSMGDGQWSSNIEQTSDKVIGLTRPTLYMEDGEVVEVGGIEYSINQKSLAFGILKQRWGPAGIINMLAMNPADTTLSSHPISSVGPAF